jgi:hypothetical protein
MRTIRKTSSDPHYVTCELSPKQFITKSFPKKIRSSSSIPSKKDAKIDSRKERFMGF